MTTVATNLNELKEALLEDFNKIRETLTDPYNEQLPDELDQFTKLEAQLNSAISKAEKIGKRSATPTLTAAQQERKEAFYQIFNKLHADVQKTYVFTGLVQAEIHAARQILKLEKKAKANLMSKY